MILACKVDRSTSGDPVSTLDITGLQVLMEQVRQTVRDDEKCRPTEQGDPQVPCHYRPVVAYCEEQVDRGAFFLPRGILSSVSRY